jgi:opacity protein-like surface antigen
MLNRIMTPRPIRKIFLLIFFLLITRYAYIDIKSIFVQYQTMNKILLFIIFLIALGMGLWAAPPLSLSAGGGGLLGYTFTRYTLEADTPDRENMKSIQTMDRFNYGGFLFFDATYGEFALSLRGGENSYSETMDAPGIHTVDRGTGSEMTLGFSLLGKYPFTINEKISLFPLLGIEYQVALLEWRKPDGDIVHDRTKGDLEADLDKNGNTYALSAWNSFTIDIGAGFDYKFKERLFLRNELLFSFRLQTPYETGALEMAREKSNAGTPTLTGLTGGPTLRTSIGYRIK